MSAPDINELAAGLSPDERRVFEHRFHHASAKWFPYSKIEVELGRRLEALGLVRSIGPRENAALARWNGFALTELGCRVHAAVAELKEATEAMRDSWPTPGALGINAKWKDHK